MWNILVPVFLLKCVRRKNWAHWLPPPLHQKVSVGFYVLANIQNLMLVPDSEFRTLSIPLHLNLYPLTISNTAEGVAGATRVQIGCFPSKREKVWGFWSTAKRGKYIELDSNEPDIEPKHRLKMVTGKEQRRRQAAAEIGWRSNRRGAWWTAKAGL